MIPVSEPLFISGEKKYLAKCIDAGWVSSGGPFVKAFEQEFSNFCQRKYGIAVSSGTAALEVALRAIGIGKGDEIIMPSFTIISCALAAISAGAVPVFIDSERETWNIDVSKIEQKITRKTKAIMVVHIYGHPCDMDPILRIAKKYNLKIIEDAAEAHGAEYKGRRCGSFGDISCFSFYANKIINCGEGGMVLTNNKKYAENCRRLRNLGFEKKKRFYHKILARNYRITNLQSALGLAQTRNIERLIKIKRENGKKYTERLKRIKGLQLPSEKKWAKNVYWMYGIVLDGKTGFNAEKLAKKLKEKGIETRPFFYPLHLQPALKMFLKQKREKLPVAERISRQGLYLPSGLGLKDWQINKVCQTLRLLLK